MVIQCCVYCHGELPENALFCPQCLHQARCKSCKELLLQKAAGCIFCGTPLNATSTTNISDSVIDSTGQGMNTLKFKENHVGRSLEVHFTDSVAESVGGALTGFFIGSTAMPVGRMMRTSIMEEALVQERLSIPSTARETQDGVQELSVSQPVFPLTTGQDEREQMHHIFQYEKDDSLWLDNTRLKATSHADATRRLTYLAVFAHELEGRKRISRAELKDVLRGVGLYDGNSSKALIESDFVLANDEIGLRITGREQAQEFMRQVLDHDVPDAWPIGSMMKARNKPSTGGDGSNEGTKSRKPRGRLPSQAVNKWVTAWSNLNLGIDGHRLVQQANGAGKGIIGLWAIRKAVGDDGRHVTCTQLAKFIYEAFVVKVSDRTLSSALASNTAKDMTLRIKESTFEITPTGMTHAEKLLGL